MEEGEVTVNATVLWVPSIAKCIASFLPPNDVACSVRLVNRAAADWFRGPEHTTVHLSQPCHPEVFARRWGDAGAVKPLTLDMRKKFVQLTAASGIVENLRVAVEVAGCEVEDRATEGAVNSGHLHILHWLKEKGLLLCRAYLLGTAARAGHESVFTWLLSNGVEGHQLNLMEAARGGHYGMISRLLLMRRVDPEDKHRAYHLKSFLTTAAHGCDLPTLQRVISDWASGALSPSFHNDHSVVSLTAEQSEEETTRRREAVREQRQLRRELGAVESRIADLSKQRQKGRGLPGGCSSACLTGAAAALAPIGPPQQHPEQRQERQGKREQSVEAAADEERRAAAELASAQQLASDLGERLRRLQQCLDLMPSVTRLLTPETRDSILGNAVFRSGRDWREKFLWLCDVGFAVEPASSRSSVAEVAVWATEAPDVLTVVATKRSATVATGGASDSSRSAAPRSTVDAGRASASPANTNVPSTATSSVTNSGSSSSSSQSSSFVPDVVGGPLACPPVQVLRQYREPSGEAVERLHWLKERGYPLIDAKGAMTIATHGNAAVMRYVVSELRAAGQDVTSGSLLLYSNVAHHAAGGGSWEVVSELMDLGIQLDEADFLHPAAAKGHLRVLQWWDGVVAARQAEGDQAGQAGPQPSPPPPPPPAEEEQQHHHHRQRHHHHHQPGEDGLEPEQAQASAAGPDPLYWIDEALWSCAAESGDVGLLTWLYERLGSRWPRWRADTFLGAARSGCQEALEWLVERGCPMGDDGKPYIAAAWNDDQATLRCLRRLGCPWGPHGVVFTACVFKQHESGLTRCSGVGALRCLLQEGCPVDWTAAEVQALRRRKYYEDHVNRGYGWMGDRRDAGPDLVLWMAGQWRRQRTAAGGTA